MDLDRLLFLRSFLLSNEDFKSLDRRGNQMYSAGLNNYYRFACSEWDNMDLNQYEKLDTPINVTESKESTVKIHSRSSILRKQALKFAKFICLF